LERNEALVQQWLKREYPRIRALAQREKADIYFRGMKRCRAEGAERFALFVVVAVLANNLMIIGELLTKRSRRRRKTNRQFLT
jgi:hypothetical protein